MKKIIILDFNKAEVFIYDIDIDIFDDLKDFFNTEIGLNHKETDCQYMVIDNLIINFPSKL